MPMMAEMQMQSKLTGIIAVQFETGELTKGGDKARMTRHIREGVGLNLNEAQVMDIARKECPDLDESRICKVRYQIVNKSEGVVWLGQAELARLNKRIAREERKAAKEQKRAEKNAAAAAKVSEEVPETIEAISEELAPEEKTAPVSPAPAIDPEEMEEQPKKAGQQRSLFSAISQTFSTITHNMIERSIDRVLPEAQRQETPPKNKAPEEIAEPAAQTTPELPKENAETGVSAISAAAKPQEFDINHDEMARIKKFADLGVVNLLGKASSKSTYGPRGEILTDGLTFIEYQKQLRRELAQYEAELQAAAKEEKKEEKADAAAAAKTANGEQAAPAAAPQTPQKTPQAKPVEPVACTFKFGVNKEFDALVGKLIDGALAGSTVTLNCEQLLQAGADAGVLQSFHITPDTPLLVRKPSLREIADARAQNNNPPRKPGRSSGKKK